MAARGPEVVIRLVPAILCALLTGAHILRFQGPVAAGGFLLLPLLFLLRKRWVVLAARGLLVAGTLAWVLITVRLVQARLAMGGPWPRLLLILSSVTAWHLIAALLLRGHRLESRYAGSPERAGAQAGAFLGALGLLVVVRSRAGAAMFLAERFVPGASWITIFALAGWAAFLAGRLQDDRQIAEVRVRAWSLFSAVFFLQLLLGLGGIERCLMSGTLHLPVPAMIVAGPVYRGGGFFMPVLFLATMVVAGPAWCSHLCYIGAWDNLLARCRPKAQIPGQDGPPPHRIDSRWYALAATVGVAFALRAIGVGGLPATLLGAAFGLLGVGIMLFASRRRGVMAHCTEWCPIGLLAVKLGKLSPFRLEVREGCRNCGLCLPTCRYGALTGDDLQRGRPGPNCTLCGDCLATCRKDQVVYKFPGLSPAGARKAFVAVVAALHAVFLGVARI
jgi:ferredoxin